MAIRGVLVNPAQWAAVGSVLNGLHERVHDNLRKQLLRTALKIERAMKKGIRDQAPGGVPFRELKPATIARKKGKSKALIDTGSLLRSIQAEKAGAKDLQVFVGIKRTARRDDGESQFDVAMVMEHGTRDGHIEPLPFVRPTFKAMRAEIEKDLEGAVGEAFRMSL